jgi:CDP-4-dehydro-6-deoxyglucose reductase, E3
VIDLAVSPGESVLICFLRNGVPISYGCKQGVCQACMLRAVKGTVSSRSQQDLRDSLRAQNYFLACRCYPSEDLTVEVRSQTLRTLAQITELDWISDSIVRLRLQPESRMPYRAGQSVNVTLPDGIMRSYSLASVPQQNAPTKSVDEERMDEGQLELHIRILPSGKMSDWIRNEAHIGSQLKIEGPLGDCFYVAEKLTGGLLLAGNGTGAGPLWGIARDALGQGHTGPIWFFHGVVDAGSLYLDRELRELTASHTNFHYLPVALRGDPPQGGSTGLLDQVMSDVMSRTTAGMAGWRAYLCGDPDLVMAMRRRCFGAGVAIHDIHADEFTSAVK